MPEMLRIPTSHAEIAVQDSGGKGPVVLLIHGNSAASEIFCRQFASPLVQDYRLLALDLLGHGASTDGVDPQGSYTDIGRALGGERGCPYEYVCVAAESLEEHYQDY